MQRLSSAYVRMAAEPTRLVQVPWWSRAWAWLERVIAEASPAPAPKARRPPARAAAPAPLPVPAAVPRATLDEEPSRTQVDPTLVLEATRALVPVPLADASSPHARAIYARAERRAQAEQARRATPTANARTPLPRDDTPVLATLPPAARVGAPARLASSAPGERSLTAVARGLTPAPEAPSTERTECGLLTARERLPDVVERFTAAAPRAPRAATIADRDALAVRPARAVVHSTTPCAVPAYASETYVRGR